MMTVSRKGPQTTGNQAARGRSWTRPTVERFEAGRAEQGGDLTTDLGTSLS
jgi:hypothetical protein